MALYYNEDTEVTDEFDDPVLLTLRRLEDDVAITGAATGPGGGPPPSCLSGVFDACGVCDGDGSTCGAVTDTPGHHSTILVAVSIFAAFMLFVFLYFAKCEGEPRERQRRRGYESV